MLSVPSTKTWHEERWEKLREDSKQIARQRTLGIFASKLEQGFHAVSKFSACSAVRHETRHATIAQSEELL